MSTRPSTLPLASTVSDRPIAFLVTTTGWAKSIARSLGSAGYSYFFAYEALRPVLEEFGVCELVERPESRLPYLAERAAAEGFEPIHLAINPPQDVYLTPAVRTIVYPFWEFPGIPDRDFGTDTRENWTRVLRAADAVVAPCSFTARAIEDAVPEARLDVVPVPLRPEHFDLPDWSAEHRWVYTGRLAVWTTEEEAPAPSPTAGRRQALLDRVEPWIGARNVRRLCLLKQAVVPGPGETRRGKLFQAVRGFYTRNIRRWLSDDAVALVTRAKRKLLKVAGIPEKVTVAPGLPERTIELSGTVFTTIFNIGDPRKNQGEILSAFLLAFRHRPDVTLVVKLVTNPTRENHEVGLLRAQYEALGIRHACKVVVITSYLSDEEMHELFRVTSFYVNHSFGEGACLPLQQALAGGRPALAPDHSAMADYVDDEVAFVTRSFPEPTHWPHDPEKRIETVRFRPVWDDLRAHFVAAERMLHENRGGYDAMSRAARLRMRERASRELAREGIARVLANLPERPVGAFDWRD